jgi:hypothetical protein
VTTVNPLSRVVLVYMRSHVTDGLAASQRNVLKTNVRMARLSRAN